MTMKDGDGKITKDLGVETLARVMTLERKDGQRNVSVEAATALNERT